LTGDNHILVRHGLDVLKASKKPGVRALLETAGVATREISPSHLGFVIGPRINASGRMGSALGAWELLTTEDPARGRVLAQELERVNQERAETQNAIWDQVRARVEEGIAQGKFKHGIVVADSGWHEGVVGIVASRVTEMFHRPAAVIALREDFGKGSVRSFAGKDVLQALRQSSAHLLGFGGHRHAAGLSCPLDQVDALAEAFDRALGELAEDAQAKPLWIEGECSLADLDFATLRELEAMGPFGPGNPEPVFVVNASARRRQILKGRHFKLQLTDGSLSTSSSGGLEAIWFHAAEREELLLDGVLEKTARWAGVPELNRFQGRVTPTFRVRDWRQTPQ
jgi:single-stranded-DNA-specific exonuclease